MKALRWLRLWLVVSCIGALLFSAGPAASSPHPSPPPPAVTASLAPSAANAETNILWNVQWIDGSKYYLDQTSLALDSQNRAHVSYYNWGDSELMFSLENGSGGWEQETLDTAGDVGKFNSIAVGSDGFDNIAYYDASNGNLKLIYNDAGGWVAPITVDGGGAGGPDVGRYPSLKLDADNLWHISYYDATNTALKYAYFQAGWHISTVDNTADVGQYSSLALDHDGNPHIAYYDATNGDLKYAYWDGYTWQISVQDSGADGPAGIGASLAAISHGFAIAYVAQAADTNRLRYISCTSYLNGPCLWLTNDIVSQSLDLDNVTGSDDIPVGVSLAVAPSGKPYIAYYKGILAGDLYVASKSEGVWTSERPDPGFNSEGAHASIAIDRYGKPHLSYLGGVDFSVKVARLSHTIFVPMLKK